MSNRTTIRRIPVAYVCTDALPGHELRVREVWFDAHAIRVEYVIVPALPAVRPETGTSTTLAWLWGGEDDAGNRYEECGGAYGPSADGERTEGVLSLCPSPYPTATRLELRLHPWTVVEPEEPTRCVFAVELRRGGPVSG